MTLMLENVDIDDVVERLRELHAYSRLLSQRAEMELHLPEHPVPYFISKIELATKRLETSEVADKPMAMRTLQETLKVSYIFYLSRLAAAADDESAWRFRFPEAMLCTHATVYTHQ